MYFAHETLESGAKTTSIVVVIVLVTLVVWAILLLKFWLLKRYSSWQFPSRNERKK